MKIFSEFGSDEGVAFCDTLVAVPTGQFNGSTKDREKVLIVLRSAKQKESDLKVRQDLDILITKTELNFRIEDFDLNRKVSFFNPTNTVYGGIKTLLDDQTPDDRRQAAVSRLRKYAGLQTGYLPITAILKERTISRMSKPGIIYPSRQNMEVILSRNANMVSGIQELFIKYKIEGWEELYAAMKKELEDYDKWIMDNLVPKGRTDFRLPSEEYKLNLETYGIDIPPAEIAKMAHAAFTSIQNQMKPLAEQLAKKYNLPSSDYRDVIRFLKKDQIIGDSILPLYESHLAVIEDIIRKQQLVTLPNRPAIIKIATAAKQPSNRPPYGPSAVFK
jgi:hypothetical protein